ncbi:MAG: ATPase, T2SS/T4P/T4SS family, partial [Patescibacteria group bacterium]
MDLLALLARSGTLEKGALPKLQKALAAPGATEEGVLLNIGVPLQDILKVKGEYYGVPTRALGEAAVPFDILRYVPEESARHYRLAPLGIVDGVLEVGVTDPDNLEARDALTFISAKVGMPYKVFLISDTDFDKLLEQYKGLSGEVGKALGDLEIETNIKDKETSSKGKKTVLEEDLITETESSAIAEDAPVTKIVATILRHAAEQRASDIHVEPMAEQTRVRFRIDGILITNITLPTKVHTSVVARVKVLS